MQGLKPATHSIGFFLANKVQKCNSGNSIDFRRSFMARHAKVLQLLRNDKGICNASFRIIAQFYNAIRLRYMRIVFVFDFAQNFLLREFNYGIDLFLIFFCLSFFPYYFIGAKKDVF